MPRDLELTVSLADAANRERLHAAIARRLGVDPQSIAEAQITRRTIDARGSGARFRLRIRVFATGEPPDDSTTAPLPRLAPVSTRGAPAVVIGAGPAGLFAALRLAERGVRVVLLERGKPVQARRRDLALLNKQGIVDPESNYCFGEGGAGTYSDGKLYTRAHKRGPVRDVLRYARRARRRPRTSSSTRGRTSARTACRRSSLRCARRSRRRAAPCASGPGRSVSSATATGCVACASPAARSSRRRPWCSRPATARATSTPCSRRGAALEPKPFAVGVRVEHPQPLIDRDPVRARRRSPAVAGGLLPPCRHGRRPRRVLVLHVSRRLDRARDDRDRRRRRQRHVARRAATRRSRTAGSSSPSSPPTSRRSASEGADRRDRAAGRARATRGASSAAARRSRPRSD